MKTEKAKEVLKKHSEQKASGSLPKNESALARIKSKEGKENRIATETMRKGKRTTSNGYMPSHKQLMKDPDYARQVGEGKKEDRNYREGKKLAK